MNTQNDEVRKDDNVEDIGQEAACAPGCSCNTTESGGRERWVVGIVIVLVAGVLVARAMIKSNNAEVQQDKTTFAAVAPATDAAAQLDVPEPPAEAADNAAAAAEPAKTKDKTVTTIAGKEIAALSELNAVAADTVGVFVFLPGKTEATAKAPMAQIRGAVRTIEPQLRGGGTIGIFTLKAGAGDYGQLASQMSVPGVVAMVKGRGMSAVSGDITEAKLIQGFVAASSAGGCGPSAGSGCCP